MAEKRKRDADKPFYRTAGDPLDQRPLKPWTEPDPSLMEVDLAPVAQTIAQWISQQSPSNHSHDEEETR